MATATATFSQWLAQAQLQEDTLTADQRALLQAAYRFRHRQGTDYYSTRLLSHFLLHCGAGLKVAPIARLLGVSRPTASRQQGLSSKEAIQQAHHRLQGRPHGKLLPRHAGPIAQFLCTHPKATRLDLLDFLETSCAVRVSRIALYKFLKKYGLDQVPDPQASASGLPPTADRLPPPSTTTADVLPAPVPAPPFCSGTPSTRAPSC
jgi:transposase